MKHQNHSCLRPILSHIFVRLQRFMWYSSDPPRPNANRLDQLGSKRKSSPKQWKFTHYLLTPPPPCWWKVRWRFIALQQNVAATRIDLKRCYSHTHTHTHLFWSQSLHCSREAKTVSMNSEWRGCMSWNDRNEERTRHLTGFSLSVESSRKRNTLDPSFYISAPLKTSRKWLNFSFVWGGANLPFSCEKSKGQVKKHPLNIL